MPPQRPGPAARQHYNVTLAVLALGGIAYALLQSLVAPALTDIQHELHCSESAVAWVLTGYLLSASVATPIVGRLGDIHGKERVLMIVLAILAVGTLISAVASSIGLLIAGRVVQGVGGGIFPLAFSIIRDEFPRDKVSGGIGLMSSLIGVGGGAGVVLAGVIVSKLSYHWLFWMPLVVIVIAAVMTHFYVPESPVKAPAKINWTAAALMSAGLAVVLLAVSQSSAWGWGSPKLLGLSAIGLVICGVWVWFETRSRVPLVDMKMMRVRGVWTTNVVAVLFGAGMYSSFVLIPTLVQEPHSTGYGFGSTITEAGLFLLPSTMAMLIVGQFSGRLERRFGSKPPLLAGSAFSIAAFAVLAAAHDQRWEIYVASGLLGLGIGLAFAAMANLIVESVRPDETGVATGMNTVMRTLGGAFGSQVAASMLASGMVGGHPTEGAFVGAFVMCTGALIASLVA
ncbi:MAG: transporter, partial [Solirubrobacteraceae bacterium]|nr:transporter [Solirubrobacteraceae bacterium]